jgi:hypothetical protein
LLILAYAIWFFRIFVIRQDPLPRLGPLSGFFGVLIFARFASLMYAPDKTLAVYDAIHMTKFALLAFWIAHHVRRKQLGWVVVCLLFGIVLESPIALYERVTGNVGIGRAKFNANDAGFGQQYEVIGLDQIRAEGTTLDSHSLGLYYSMLLTLPFILMMLRTVRPWLRIGSFALFVLGALGLVVTFSRSSWVTCAVCLSLALGIVVLLWGEGKAVPLALTCLLALTLLFPRGYSYIYDRMFNSPPEIMAERADMNRTGREIWLRYPLFGYGWMNGLDLMEDPALTIHGNGEQPVHNLFLIIGSDMGLLGFFGFFGMIATACAFCIRPMRGEDMLVRCLALTVLLGLLGYVLHGWAAGPTYKDAVPFCLFWTYLALARSFDRLMTEGRQARSPVVDPPTAGGDARTVRRGQGATHPC